MSRELKYKVGDHIAFRYKSNGVYALLEGEVIVVDRRTFMSDEPSVDVLVGYPGVDACVYKHVSFADVLYKEPDLFDDEEANQ